MRSRQLQLDFLQDLLAQRQQDYKAVAEDYKVELDATTKNRLERQMSRLLEEIDRLDNELQKILKELEEENKQSPVVELKTILREHGDCFNEMQRAYQCFWQQRSFTAPFQPSSSDEMISQLLSLPPVRDRIYAALEDFAVQLIQVTGTDVLKAKLQIWGQQQLGEAWGDLFPLPQPTEQQEIKEIKSVLLINLLRSDEASTQSETEENYYQIKAWVIEDVQHYVEHQEGMHAIQLDEESDAATYALSTLSDELPMLICQFLVESEPLLEEDPELHIFLPLELMNDAVDRWQINEDYGLPQSLGCDYQVVLRCTERVSRSYRRAKLWKKKWQQHQTLLETIAHTAFIPMEEDNLVKLRDNSDECLEPVVGFTILQAPTRDSSNRLFGVLLQVGMPLAIWSREDLQNVSNASELDRVLKGCCLANLPDTVTTERRRSRQHAEDSHIGHHLSLLWDDPRLVPPRSA